MKNKMIESIHLLRGFMQRNFIWMLSIKVVKIILLLFFFSSCGDKPETKSTTDSLQMDTINGAVPGDSTMFKNEEEEEEEEDKQEDDGNPISPQES